MLLMNGGLKPRSRKLVACLVALIMLFTGMGLGSPGSAWAKTGESEPAESLIVNILNPDGSTTLVHEYVYSELEPLEEIGYYATIDALPTGVGTKAKGVKINDLITDAQKYNSNLKWESGQKLVFYVTDAPGTPYQGNNYYTHDFLYGQDRYYFPNLVETYNPEDGREAIDLTGAVPVEPMLASLSYQDRGATDADLKNDSIAIMDGTESFRFCMGITEAEARNENFSSTNKFGRWIYRVDVGPVNGAKLKADTTGNEVGEPIEITFTDNADWRAAISSVKVNDSALTGEQYAVEAGKITINPGVFTAGGAYTVTVEASGFMNSTVTQNITQSPAGYTVTFNSGENGSLTATVDNLAISSGNAVEPGKTVVFTAVPAEGYQVKQWTVDSQAVPDNKTNTLTVENLAAAKTVNVEFEAVTAGAYTVTVDSSISGGTVAVNPASGNAGTTITVTVTPDTGKRLVAGSLKYSTDGGATYPEEITASDEVYSFALPAANVTVTALFENSGSGTGVWDGTIDVSWYNTNDSVFYIDTPAKLAGLAAIVNGTYNEGATVIGNADYIVANVGGGTITGSTNTTWIYGADDFDGKTVKLTADLDMGGVYDNGTNTWSGPNYMPIGGQYCMAYQDGTTLIGSSWNGIFDGQGHTVKNIYCSRHAGSLGYEFSQSVGLIGRLGIHDSDVANGYNTLASPAVKNVAVTGYIYANRSVGGIVGKNGKSIASLIENCINYASVNNTDSKGVGGIAGAGWNNLTIRNCANLGEIYTSYSNAGGISGSCEAKVYNSYNVGYVGASNANQAQSLGTNNGGAVWTNCYWLDNSSASNQAVYGSTTGSTITQMMTPESMKEADFLAVLNGGGRAWVADAQNINNGYPIPRVMSGDTSTLTDISKESDPAKLSYAEGETFDPAGLVIWANYSDGTREKITDYTISKTTPLENTDTSINVSGSYDGMAYSYDFTITVTGNPLQSIAITTLPTNCLYAAGESFDPTGMVVKANYSNGPAVTLTAGQYTITPSVFAPGDDKVTIGYTSSGTTKTVDQPVTVLASAVPVLNEDVYELSSADHMRWFANQVNTGIRHALKAKLTANVDLSGVPWTPIGNSFAQFYAGIFDGNGKTVTLAIEDNGVYSGLFGSIQGTTIKDLTVAGSVSGSQATAGIVVNASGASLIQNCVNNAAVTGTGAGDLVGGIVAGANDTVTISSCINNGDISNAAYQVGGVVGYLSGSVVVTGCTNTGAVSGSYNIGGIVGNNSGNTIVNNCLNTGAVTATSTGTDANYSAGGIVGYTKFDVKINQCANRGAVSGSVMNVGGVAGYLSGSGTIFTDSYNTGSVTSTSTNASANTGGVVGRMHTAACTVQNTYNAGTVTGNGTSPNTAGVIGYAAGNTNVSNNYYLNTSAAKGLGNAADNAAGKTSDELKSTEFLAGLNGEGRFFVADTNNSNSGYPILRVMAEDASALSGISKESDPTKLSYIEGQTFDTAGLVIWANYSDGTREKVTDYTISKTTALETTDTTITVSGTRGGMPYSYDFTITVAGPPAMDSNNVYQLVTADHMIWFANQVNSGLNKKIKGKLMQDIDLSAVTWQPIGNSSPMAYTGVFDGNGKTVTLAISGTANYSGLFGYVDGGTVKNLAVAGSVSGGQYTAGIVANAQGAAVIENCVNGANVTGTYHVGGIVGSNSGTGEISRCANSGTITAISTSALSTYGVGGIVGYVSAGATIDQCSNSGAVNGGIMNVGGVVGYLNNASAAVTNSYNTGSATSTSTSATARTGGLIGTSNKAACTVQNIYNAGTITGNGTSPNTAGVIGYAADSTNVSNNYYLNTTATKGLGNAEDNAVSKTSDELKALAPVLGQYFKAGSLYPILTWQSTASPETYTVTVDNNISGGSIAVNPTSGNAGTAITVTVTPANDKQLVAGSLKYTSDGGSTYTSITATGGVYSFILPAADVTVTALFENIPAVTYYTLTLSGEGLSSEPAAGEIAAGTSVTITATPATGKQVKTFTVNGTDQKAQLTGTPLQYVFTLTDDTTVAVTYEDKTGALIAEQDGNIPITGQPVTITVPSGVTDSGITVTQNTALPAVKIESNRIDITIPQGTQVNGSDTIKLPEIRPGSSVNVPEAKQVDLVVKIGSEAGTITFTKPVRLVLKDQGNKSAGFIDNQNNFKAIQKLASLSGLTRDSDADAVKTALTSAGVGEGAVTSGNDLIIWTNHFTRFIAYTPKTGGGGTGGGGGGGGSSTPSYTIDRQGGTIKTAGAEITFPAEAVNNEIKVTVKKLSTGLPAVPEGYSLMGEVYEISSNTDTGFRKPVTITLPLDQGKIDLEKQEVSLYCWNNSRWEPLSQIKLEAGKISGETEHFSKFAVLSSKKAAPEEEVKTPDQETTPPVPAQLKDLSGHWAQGVISELIKAGAISGYPDGSFRPDSSITRAEFAAVLVKALKLEPRSGVTFSDTVGHWAQVSIETAAGHGIVSGYENGSFGPDNLITREQMAVMIVKAADLSAGEGKTFTDAGQIGAWAKTAVAAASGNSIISGYPDGSFRPQANATRAEAAAVIVKILH